ncbi:hypothetical protein BX666DRAFT_1993345 [Dichotomocladium elegans]|nr:hypothetical protein BX666DRAFT_1993345 [Dichotomocladium elegans]
MKQRTKGCCCLFIYNPMPFSICRELSCGWSCKGTGIRFRPCFGLLGVLSLKFGEDIVKQIVEL